MLDVKQLRVLRAVAEHGSFSAAAEALSYTQPAISQQVAALERQTGTTLVDRTSRGVRLTDAGLEAMAGIRGGRVRLASFPTAGASLLPPAVALFTERHPHVELSFVEREPEEAAQMLRAAELEVAIVFEYAEYDQPELEHFYEGIELQRLVDDPMYLALPLGHPAAHKPHVRLRDLSEETWIQESGNHSWCGRFHETACLAAGFKPKVGFRSDDYNVVQGLVAAGAGKPAVAGVGPGDDPG